MDRNLKPRLSFPEELDKTSAVYYGDADPTTVAEGWRPFRTWATVLTRIAAEHDTRI